MNKETFRQAFKHWQCSDHLNVDELIDLLWEIVTEQYSTKQLITDIGENF